MIRRAAALLALSAPLVACQATAQVSVTVGPRSTGDVAVSVTLDREAAARMGDVATALRVSDLERQGWVLEPVTTAPDGSVTATIQHPFGSIAAANSLLAGVGGSTVHLVLSRSSGLLTTRMTVSGALDLSGGVDAFADDRLRSALGVTSVASLVAALRAAGGVTPALGAGVVLHLPGHPTSVSPGGVVNGDSVRWVVPLGSRLSVGAAAVATDRTRETWFVAAAALLVLALASALVIPGRPSRRPRRRGQARPSGRRHHDSWSLSGPIRR